MSKEEKVFEYKTKMVNIIVIYGLIMAFMHMTTPEEREELKKELIKDLKEID